MEKDQIILLEDRGLISITGEDTKNFLQNIITNDIEKVKYLKIKTKKFFQMNKLIGEKKL